MVQALVRLVQVLRLQGLTHQVWQIRLIREWILTSLVNVVVELLDLPQVLLGALPMEHHCLLMSPRLVKLQALVTTSVETPDSQALVQQAWAPTKLESIMAHQARVRQQAHLIHIVAQGSTPVLTLPLVLEHPDSGELPTRALRLDRESLIAPARSKIITTDATLELLVLEVSQRMRARSILAATSMILVTLLTHLQVRALQPVLSTIVAMVLLLDITRRALAIIMVAMLG